MNEKVVEYPKYVCYSCEFQIQLEFDPRKDDRIFFIPCPNCGKNAHWSHYEKSASLAYAIKVREINKNLL